MFSYWEQQSFLEYDHIIVGAGIVGMSVGIELRHKYPNDRILILERGFMPTGASSRNAGFACMGSASELLSDLKTMNEEEVLSLFAARKRGLEILRRRLGDNTIAYSTNGSYELIDQAGLPIIEQLDYLNELLYPINSTVSFQQASNKIAGFGFSTHYTKALIENNCEGEIHTGKMLRALCDYTLQKNIEIKTGAEVSSFEETENAVLVFIPDILRKEEWRLKCKNIYICTNAFTPKLLADELVIPGRGQVLITKPIAKLPFKGIYHFNEGYYYFRAIDGRVLLGGGRNLDFDTERTTKIGLNNNIQNHLDKMLKDIIIPNQAFEIEQRWSGIMAFGDTKTPIVRAFSTRVYGAFRMGGMGVALGSEVASRLMQMIHD